MDYHHHARLTIHRREELAETVIQGRLSLKEAAAEFKLSRQSAAKWVRRFRAEGRPGLRDHSSRPRRSPRSTPAELVARVERYGFILLPPASFHCTGLRHLRWRCVGHY